MIQQLADNLKTLLAGIQSDPAILSKFDLEIVRAANAAVEKANPDLVWCFLDISTGHLSEMDQKAVEGIEAGPFYAKTHDYGCEFRVPSIEEMIENKELVETFSPAFLTLLEYARERGCGYINADVDAVTTEDLQYFG